MNRATDWENTRAAIGGEREQLSTGGHVCKILSARVESVKGHEQMVLFFDVDEGSEFDGIFKRQYDAVKGSQNAKWPNSGTFRQFTRMYGDDSKTNPYFKGLISAVCESNPGYQWDWNERSLTGKYIGLVFGEEEYMGNDGTIKTTVKARYCCPSAEAADKEPPKKKEYGGPRPQTGTASVTTGGGFEEVPDDDLPFDFSGRKEVM